MIWRKTDFLTEWMGRSAGLLGVWFPEAGLCDAQQWTESFLFNFFKIYSVQKERIWNVLPAARSQMVPSSFVCICMPALAREAAHRSGVPLPRWTSQEKRWLVSDFHLLLIFSCWNALLALCLWRHQWLDIDEEWHLLRVGTINEGLARIQFILCDVSGVFLT